MRMGGDQSRNKNARDFMWSEHRAFPNDKIPRPNKYHSVLPGVVIFLEGGSIFYPPDQTSQKFYLPWFPGYYTMIWQNTNKTWSAFDNLTKSGSSWECEILVVIILGCGGSNPVPCVSFHREDSWVIFSMSTYLRKINAKALCHIKLLIWDNS